MNQKGFATISLLRFGLHKRSLHNRGFAPVLILLVVLAVGAVGYILIPKPGGIEYIKSQLTWPRPTPTPTPPPGCQYEEVICIQAPCPPVLVCPSPTPGARHEPNGSVETTNWKEYVNTKYGYQLKHPPGFAIDNKSEEDVWINKQIVISVSTMNPDDCRGPCPVVSYKETTKVNGMDAVKRSGYIGAIGGETPQSYEEVVIPHRDKFYMLTAYELKTDEDLPITREIKPVPQEILATFNQILSTFNFTQ